VTKPNILVIEDEVHLREVLRFQLEAAGFEVRLAADGIEGIEAAHASPPELVLLDIMMPGLDGYEVARRLRESFTTRHVPIIMLTAKGEIDDKVAGLEGGANDYVTKPWEQKELIVRVRNVLEWSRQQRSASPLTGLPGNLTIYDEIQRRLERPEPFALLQIDIDYFKAFNDFYGYARGDVAIQRLAQIVVDASARNGGHDNFVGHIGGDDFVIVTGTGTAEPLAEAIITGFDAALPSLYDEPERRQGYVEVRNRRHVLERFPLMSVTIALVSTDRMPISHLAQLIDVAQELKAHGKGIPGSVLVNERRQTRSGDGDQKVA
jgi:PleD family two-component response regulator